MVALTNSRFMRTITLLITIFFLSLPAYAQYSGGTGEPNDPYQIATAEDLMLLGESPEDYDKHFILTADIDLDPNLPGRKVFNRAVIAHDTLDRISFTGAFDGNNHTISHLTITGGGYLGLFGQTGFGARISNLGLEAVDVSGSNAVGGLVGENRYGSSITTSYITGSISGNEVVGGLVGANCGGITTSYSTGTVSGDGRVGGLAGSNGIHGGMSSITSSYSTGSVSGDYNVGGLVGENTGSITMSVWDMEASGMTVSSGGVGLTAAEMMDPYMLGLNGFTNDPNWILDAGRDYPRLAWEGTAGQIIPEPIVDLLDGKGTEKEPYRVDRTDQLILLTRASGLWDKHFVLGADINLDPNLPGRKVFSQAVIQVFSGVFDGNDHTISHLTIRGRNFVGLFGQLGPGASISNLGLEAVDVNGIGEFVGGLLGYNDGGDLSTSYNTGTVSGDWYVGGLVGYNDGGSLNNSYSAAMVNGTGGNNVGGLVGYNNEGSITSSYSAGTVSGYNDVGGLVGWNEGSITSSYSTGSVSGYDDVGGLVGENGCWKGTGSITACYSTGTVNGNASVGGLVGSNRGDFEMGRITMSYSTGTVSGDSRVGGLVGSNDAFGGVSIIPMSVWDMETSGLTVSDGGIGLTTAEMQTASTFLEARWDFMDETINGIEDIWWIDEGQDYPRLWWEAAEQ